MTTTGTTVLRRALVARAKHGHLGVLSRDIGVPLPALEAFAYSQAELPAEAKSALAKDLFEGHAEYDPGLYLLRSVNKREPVPLGTHPDPIRGSGVVHPIGQMTQPGPRVVKVPAYRGGSHELVDASSLPEQPERRRPGWLE